MIREALNKIRCFIVERIEISTDQKYMRSLYNDLLSDAKKYGDDIDNKRKILVLYRDKKIDDEFLLTKSGEIIDVSKQITKKVSRYNEGKPKQKVRYKELYGMYKLITEATSISMIMQDYITQYRVYLKNQ